MKKGLVKQLLSQGSWTAINKPLMKKIGLDCTYMFQYLLDLQDNVFDGEFFQQQDRIAEEFGWTVYKVQTVIKQLVGYGLMSVSRRGLPAKNFYSINDEQVVVILNNLTSILSSENLEDKTLQIDIHNTVDIDTTGNTKMEELATPKSKHIEHTNSKQPNKNILKEQPNIKHTDTSQLIDSSFLEAGNGKVFVSIYDQFK